MDLLEFHYTQQPSNEHYVPRKCHIPHQKHINLFGVRASGKTSMAIDILEQAEGQSLYIDFSSPSLSFEKLNLAKLQEYINNEKISFLILDHYHEDYLEDFPKVQRLLVLSRLALQDPLLKPIELFPLDYEEFLAFESNTSTQTGFKHFLRLGTLPQFARSQKTNPQAMKTFFHASFSPNEQKLLLVLAQHHTKHLSIHQIYTFAKEKFKVSKDWLYKTIKTFQEEKVLLFIDDRYQKSGKKMLLFDFAFAKYLTIGQPFIMQFDTMIALALMKHHIGVQTLGIHGYITNGNELIIPAPFESEESLWVKSQKKFSLYKKYGIQKISIITMTNSYEYHIENLHFEALPFDEWSVINDEE